MAGHADPRTTKLYDRRADRVTLDEVECESASNCDPRAETPKPLVRNKFRSPGWGHGWTPMGTPFGMEYPS